MRIRLLLAALLAASTLHAQDWIGTWSPADMALIPANMANPPLGQQDVTIRQVVHISQGGKRMRITFTNEFGTTPLRIAAAHVAFLSAGSTILSQTDRALTFNGQPGITLAPGQFVSSDAVAETVPIFSDLVISTAVPAQPLPAVTGHIAAHTSTFFAAGDQTAALQFASPTTTAPDATSSAGAPALLLQNTSWYFLRDVQVDATRKSAALVAFGDSITDGTGSTSGTNRRWPDVFAALLANNTKTASVAVLNKGIGGNRVLTDDRGQRALDRFDRDVLSQPHARFVVLMEGINDIGVSHRTPAEAVTAQQIIDGLTTLAARAHAVRLKVFAATLTPFIDAAYYGPEGEVMRQQVNKFLRTSTAFDGLLDFDKVLDDPANPGHMQPKFDCGDHLHPSDMGYAAMANSINLKLFEKK